MKKVIILIVMSCMIFSLAVFGTNETTQTGEPPVDENGNVIPPPDGDSRSMEGPMTDMENMLSVDEANALEEVLLEAVGYSAVEGGYPIVDTNQTIFYSNDAIIDAPVEGKSFYGQDANYSGNQPSYTDNGDGTISDNVTGLMWQQDPGDKVTWEEAVNNLEAFNEAALGGYSDWRIPTIKDVLSR